MNKKIEIEISAKDIEKKDMLKCLVDVIEGPCQETSSIDISYSEEEEDGDIIKNVKTTVSAKYINWKEILENINEIDESIWQEITSLDISYSEENED